MDELRHPRWCDRAHCTATALRPEYRAGETGFHRSAPVPIRQVSHVAGIVFDPELRPLVAHLVQPAPPWDPVTYLNLGTLEDPDALSLPAAQASEALRQLESLLSAAETEESATGEG